MAADVKDAERLFLAGEFEKSFALLRLLTKDEKNGRARYLMGLFYLYGIFVPQNDDIALEYMDKAYTAGEPLSLLYMLSSRSGGADREAYRKWIKKIRGTKLSESPFGMHQIGKSYEKGLATEKNYEKALLWYEKAASLGLVMAMADAGNIYRDRSFSGCDFKKAYSLFLEGAAKGYHEAEAQLADCFYCGLGTEADGKKAIVCFERAADHGNSEACDALGTLYVLGNGVEADAEKAFQYFRKGTEGGSAACCFKWGDCYFYGRGTEINYPRAMELYKKAWDMGYTRAASAIGMLYLMGTAGPKDASLGVEWLQKAADAGDIDGMTYLGKCCAEGIGMRSDREKAKLYLEEAAQGGQVEAMSLLGELALSEKKPEEAVHHFEKAAAYGYTRAENFLGLCYAEGLGVARNLRMAEEWLRKSEAAGDKDARMLMKQYLM